MRGVPFRFIATAVGLIVLLAVGISVLCSLSAFLCFWISAAGNTFVLFTGSAALGLLIGFFVGWGRSSGNPLVSLPLMAYVEIFRGIPRIVIVLMAIIVFPMIGLRSIDQAIIWGIVALGVSSGAYQAEVFRSGFQSVVHGQIEAAKSIGMNRWQTMRHVILPQLVRVILPPLGNEWIIVLKDTSLLVLLPGLPRMFPGVFELTARARFLQTTVFDVTLWPLIFLGAAAIYMGMTILISKLIQLAEEKYKVPGLGVLAA